MSETIKLDKPVLGINNVDDETNLPQGSVREAVNVDIDNAGDVRRRGGYKKIYSGKKTHSIFERYFVEGTELKHLEPDNSASVIETGMGNQSFLAYCKVHGDIYYSDGQRNRIIGKGAWGIPTPPNNPQLTQTTGKLDAGVYQVSICYQDPDNGEISGALLASTITVNSNAGIVVSDIPVSPDGYNVVLYVSTANGSELYQNAIIPNGITAFTVISVKSNTRLLDTQFMAPLPGGHIIRHFKSRMYVARDNVLWFSQAMRYGLRKSKDFFQFPERIAIVQPVTDGIYVVADKTYFLSGTEPKAMQQFIVSDDPAIEGTGIAVGGAAFDLESNIMVAYWFSNKGAVLGLPGGSVRLLTENRLALNKGINSGVTLFREYQGIRQMITSFSNKGTSSEFFSGAQASSHIIRNGVVIP